MPQSFDPLNLDARSSLNSTRIAALPGIDPAVECMRALDLLSSFAIAEAVRRESQALGLPGSLEDRAGLLLALDDRLAFPEAAVRAAAEHFARRLGSYLAYLLLTLKRDRRDPEMRAYREHWSTIGTVRLGGGLVSGRLGAAMRDSAGEVLASNREVMRLDIAPYPAFLPLVGAALSAEASTRRALVCDFGGTLVKHGWSHYRDGLLTHVALLQPRPVPASANVTSREDEEAIGQSLAGFICDVIEADARNAGFGVPGPALRVVACLASYLRNNHPPAYAGAGYPALRHLGANAGEWLATELSRRLHHPVKLTLLHDGTSAARVFAGQPATAVIMMGTWLGIGFAPPEAKGVGLAAGFAILEA